MTQAGDCALRSGLRARVAGGHLRRRPAARLLHRHQPGTVLGKRLRGTDPQRVPRYAPANARRRCPLDDHAPHRAGAHAPRRDGASAVDAAEQRALLDASRRSPLPHQLGGARAQKEQGAAALRVGLAPAQQQPGRSVAHELNVLHLHVRHLGDAQQRIGRHGDQRRVSQAAVVSLARRQIAHPVRLFPRDSPHLTGPFMRHPAVLRKRLGGSFPHRRVVAKPLGASLHGSDHLRRTGHAPPLRCQNRKVLRQHGIVQRDSLTARAKPSVQAPQCGLVGAARVLADIAGRSQPPLALGNIVVRGHNRLALWHFGITSAGRPDLLSLAGRTFQNVGERRPFLRQPPLQVPNDAQPRRHFARERRVQRPRRRQLRLAERHVQSHR